MNGRPHPHVRGSMALIGKRAEWDCSSPTGRPLECNTRTAFVIFGIALRLLGELAVQYRCRFALHRHEERGCSQVLSAKHSISVYTQGASLMTYTVCVSLEI